MPRINHPSWTYKIPQWVIFDLDGTLADIKHRLHYIKSISEKNDSNETEEFIPDWDVFNMSCNKDEPNQNVIDLLIMCQNYGKSIAIFTGRMETARKRTIEWLDFFGIKYDILEMRMAKDYRSDIEVKKEMFQKYFNIDQVWFVVENRDKVASMWRELGLTCFQLQQGDY